MTESILDLSDSELRDLATSLRAGRIASPISGMVLQRIISSRDSQAVANSLEALRTLGADAKAIAAMLELLVADRMRRPRLEDLVDLVTTGPEASNVANRDTSVVVRELFAGAKSTVLVVGYAVYQGRRVFSALAERMSNQPQLRVRLFLDIQRQHGDTSAPRELSRRFADRLVNTQWPPNRPLPTVYFLTASLELEPSKRTSLHAKCVVVDGDQAFISSANFTEAAQERNIEVGVLIRSKMIAKRITTHFDALVADGSMEQLALPNIA